MKEALLLKFSMPQSHSCPGIAGQTALKYVAVGNARAHREGWIIGRVDMGALEVFANES